MRCLLVTSFVLISAVAYGQADPDLSVVQPFATTTAKENVQKCSPGTDTSELGRVNYIQYDFVPPKGGDGQDSSPSVSITRKIAFAIPELAVTEVSRKIHSFDHTSCESEALTSGITMTIPDQHHVNVYFHVEAGASECGSILGISYKQPLGSGYADVLLKYLVNQNLQIQTDGAPVVYNEHYDPSPFFDFLGIVSGLGPPVTNLLKSMIQQEVQPNLDKIRTQFDVLGDKKAFAAFNASNSSITAYGKALDALGSPSWNLSTIPTASGFTPGNVIAPEFVVEQGTVLPPWNGPTAYSIRVGEIAYLRDLAKPSPRKYVAQANDNLWNIAKSFRLDPHTFIWIEDLNGLRGKALKVGQSITVPLLYEECEQVAVRDTLIRPRDSVWGVNIRKAGGFRPNRSQLRSGRLSLVYPFESIE